MLGQRDRDIPRALGTGGNGNRSDRLDRVFVDVLEPERHDGPLAEYEQEPDGGTAEVEGWGRRDPVAELDEPLSWDVVDQEVSVRMKNLVIGHMDHPAPLAAGL